MIRTLITLLALPLMLALGTPAMANDDNGPKAVVEASVLGIIQVLEARADTNRLTEANREAIRKVVDGRFDYAEMAQRSVGRAWNSVSDEQHAQFADVFRELLERSYGNRLAEYNGQKVVFDDAEFKGDKARVKSRVIDTNKETPLEYRLHQTATGWQVYDIRIEGVSLVSTFRKDFAAQLEKGSFTELLTTLQDKVAKLKAKDQG